MFLPVGFFKSMPPDFVSKFNTIFKIKVVSIKHRMYVPWNREIPTKRNHITQTFVKNLQVVLDRNSSVDRKTIEKNALTQLIIRCGIYLFQPT